MHLCICTYPRKVRQASMLIFVPKKKLYNPMHEFLHIMNTISTTQSEQSRVGGEHGHMHGNKQYQSAEVAPQHCAETMDENLCVICEEKPATHAVVPCGHKCLCGDHAEAVCLKGECPMCRTPVQTCIRIYGR
jgi:hypothetical protein